MKRSAVIVVLAPLSAALAQVDHPAPVKIVAPPAKVIPAEVIQPVEPRPEEVRPARAEKPPIYDEKADARVQIAAALKSAAKENRRVLIQWGGNWCGWCHLLHEKFQKDPALARELMYEYDVVLVDAGRNGKNLDLAQQYKADAEAKGYPYLTILDATGKVLANEETGQFETKSGPGEPDAKPGHDAAKVLKFLKSHEAKPLAADMVLKKARDAAKGTDRKVFVHFGAPWCGWCKRLDAWLAREDVSTLFGKDFVEVKIDQDRMTNAKEVFATYKKNYDKTGIPWFVIIDAATGEAISTSDAAAGNIGFPNTDEEIAHFAVMLKTSAKKMTDADIEALKRTLVEGRAK